MEMELEGVSNGQETARAPPPPELPWMVQVHLQLYIIVAVGRIAMSRSGIVIRRFLSTVDRLDKNGIRSADVTVDASCGLWAHMFLPPPSSSSQAKEPLPVLVYFHSSAFTLLSAASIPYHRTVLPRTRRRRGVRQLKV